MEKLIITAALTGAEVTKDQQPNLPINPSEIAQSAYDCYLAGASIIHVHARDENGYATQSLQTYKIIKEKIESKCNVIFQPSTGGAVYHSFEERKQPLSLNPEMATLSAGTTNFGKDIFANPQEYIENFALEMKERKIKPEIEVFERGHISNALRLEKKELLKKPIHFDFVLGVPGAMPGEVEDLIFLVKNIPEGSTWTVAGIGKYELPLSVHAILMGGHVRVGFEDNIYFRKGELAKSNAQLVERIAKLSLELGREIATPDEARKILNIAGGQK